MFVFYDGPSVLTGDRVVGILTGFETESKNPKTGPMVQAWILRADMPPTDAVRSGNDDAICGSCALRGEHGLNRRCYVPQWIAPLNIWKAWTRGKYQPATRAQLQAVLEGQYIRCGAYGDPVAMPYEVWQNMLATVAGWVGYTHQWLTCDPRFRQVLMASVESEADGVLARRQGWRTFRVRTSHEPVVDTEFTCPATLEDGATTCQDCQSCRGSTSAAKSVAILAHGHNGSMTAWRRVRALRLEPVTVP